MPSSPKPSSEKQKRVRSFFLSQDAADNLVAYQYHAGEYSALDLFLNPFWLVVANCIPRWISPNMVTLTGLLVHFGTSTWAAGYFLDLVWGRKVYDEFTASGLDGVAKAASKSKSSGSFWTAYLGAAGEEHVAPTFSELCDGVPNWVYLACAFSSWLYQTLDAADGKHARNTKQSTPLGALFDHGCDACSMLVSMVVCSLTVFQTANAEGPGEHGSFVKWAYFSVIGTSLTSFYLAQWEHQHTGVLPTMGVTEAQWSGMLFLVAISFPSVRAYLRSPVDVSFLDQFGVNSDVPGAVVDFLGIQERSSVVFVLVSALPCSVCVLIMFRVFRRYYLGWLLGEPDLHEKQGNPCDTSAGFFLSLFQAFCLFLIPDVWANNWSKISALFGLTCLYLSLRSIVSGLCNCAMRGTPRTLYPVFLSIFLFLASELYGRSLLCRSWADRFLMPAFFSLFSTVLLPLLETALSTPPFSFAQEMSALLLTQVASARTYFGGLLLERATLGEISENWSDAGTGRYATTDIAGSLDRPDFEGGFGRTRSPIHHAEHLLGAAELHLRSRCDLQHLPKTSNSIFSATERALEHLRGKKDQVIKCGLVRIST